MSLRPLPALIACLVVLGLGGCGSGDEGEIPPETASELIDDLNAIQEDVDKGRCDGAEAKLATLQGEIGSLDGVPARVERGLLRLADQLEELLVDCQPKEEDETETDSSSTSTTTTPTAEPEPTTTSTDTSTTEEEPTEPSTSTDPPEQPTTPGGSGGGGGGGGGGSGDGGIGPGGVTPERSDGGNR